MNERSGSSHPRDAFAVLVAARPDPPAELTSPDTRGAEAMFLRILDEPGRRHSPASHRRQFSLAVGAAAAAAVVGILLTVPGRGGPSSVGSSETDTPSPTDAATEVLPPGTATSTDWPSIPASPPVGDASTARATMIVDGDPSTRTDFTMVDGDVNVGIYRSPDPDPAPGANVAPQLAVGPPELVAENRYVGGEWYFHLRREDGEMEWSYDPNDEGIFVGVTPSDPRELLDRLSPTAGFEADGTDFVRGTETVHLVATTPGAVDPSLLHFDPTIADSIDSLELWVDSNGIVRRIDVEYAGATSLNELGNPEGTAVVTEEDTNSTVSIEFYDIGEPITIDVPRNAVEVDAQG